MKYAKPPLSFEQQADLLISRGLIASRDEIVEKLQVVNYYRLSAYWYPFRQFNEQDPTTRKDDLVPGTTLKMVWDRYTFDRQLRLLVMDAVERIEVAVRTRMAKFHAAKYGPFGYLNSANFAASQTGRNPWQKARSIMKKVLRPCLPHAFVAAKYYLAHHDTFIERVRQATRDSKETFVRHYFQKYSSERDLPIWMVVEVMSLGNMLAMFDCLKAEEKRELASCYGLMPPVLASWLLTLNYVRNLCAHHSRLWNRTLAIRPNIPNKKHAPDWHAPVTFGNEKVFAVLTLLRYMLARIAPQSNWPVRLEALFQKYPEISVSEMGFPGNWHDSPLWKRG